MGYGDHPRLQSSGVWAAKLDTWVTEERNVYEDYKRVFGKEPSLISGVAIMTDTDNTGESAEAYYGDIIFKRRHE